MKWLEETHGTKFELVRHFLARMFDSEMFSTRGQWRTVAVSAFALALPAGMVLLDPLYAAKYRGLSMLPSPEPFRAAAIADELSLLTLVFAITGLLALLQWRSLFPSGRDYLALAGLPIRSRQIFAARFTSVLLFSIAIVVAMNLLPSIIAPLEFAGRWQKNPSYLVNMAAQAVSSGLACFFILFAIVALQGVLLNALPWRLFARVSPYVQGVLIAVLFLTALFSWSITDWQQDTIARLPQFGAWAPPVWFAGLHERMIGDRDPFFTAMAGRALLAAAAAAVMAVLTYFISYRRCRRLLLEAPVAVAPPRTRQWSVLRLLARDPRQEAVMQFMSRTLARSPLHRLVLLAYIGAAVGIMLNSSLIAGAALKSLQGWREALQFVVLFWPLGTSFVILAGFRHVFSMPAELGANWIFRMTESQGRAQWMSAVERFVVACAIVPIYLVLSPVAIAVVGWPVAARMTVLEVLASLSAFEFLFHSWQQLPFTCSYVPGKRPLMSVLASWLGVLGVIVPVLTVIIATASRMTETFLVCLALFGPAWVWARRRRRDGWGEARIIYEDVPEAVPDLGIKNMRFYPGQTAAPAAGRPRPAPLPGSGGPAPAWLPAPQRAQSAAWLRERILPEFLATTWLRLKALVNRRQLDRDLQEEVQFHLAMRERKYEAEGIPPGEAQAAARRQFGNVSYVKEVCRDMWTFVWLETFWQDLRYGARQLRRSPGFTAVAAVTLALGIGATTSVFSMCDTVLWRPVALPHLETLVMVLQAVPGNPHFWTPASPADIEDIRRTSAALEGVASWAYGMANIVEAGGEPVRVEQVRVSPNFFDVLGVQPALGRAFQPAEDQPGRDREVILSDSCWRRRFGADPGIIGRSIRLEDRNHTVIGVMPPAFGFPRVSKELWTPLALKPAERHSRSAPLVDSIGRLKPGHTREQVAAELNGIAARLEKLYPNTNKNRRFVAWPVHRFWSGDYAPRWGLMLLGAALFVLLIACVNVANLQFARATGRGREVAVRTALGAGRRRILRQLVTESVLLAVAGAAVGLLVAKWGLSTIKAGVPAEMRQYMPGWNDIGLNARALGFALAAAMLSGILAGLAPAWRCSRANLTESLKEGGRGSSAGRGRHRLRSVLVAGEIALATVLLAGAALMVRGFRAGLGGGASLEPATLLTLRLALSENKYQEDYQVAEFYREVLERTSALPGVRSAVAVTALPHSRHGSIGAFSIEGRQPQPGSQPNAQVQAVSPGYFKTMHIPLRAGRLPGDGDGADTARVAVISERMAQRWWPGEPPPIGKRIRLGAPGPDGAAQGPWVTIVGVVGDVENSVLNPVPQPALYLPYMQSPGRDMDIGIRTAGDPMRLGPAVRAAIRSIDPEQPITNLNTLETLIHQEAFGFAYMAVLMGVFGALALALSSIGVYGVMAYLVSEQTHEIGIRMALGAPRAKVLGMVFRRGMLTTAAGLAVGLIPACGLARLMQALVWGVTARDPVAFLGMPLALIFAAALAIYIPARRAMRIDPILALRNE